MLKYRLFEARQMTQARGEQDNSCVGHLLVNVRIRRRCCPQYELCVGKAYLFSWLMMILAFRRTCFGEYGLSMMLQSCL